MDAEPFVSDQVWDLIIESGTRPEWKLDLSKVRQIISEISLPVVATQLRNIDKFHSSVVEWGHSQILIAPSRPGQVCAHTIQYLLNQGQSTWESCLSPLLQDIAEYIKLSAMRTPNVRDIYSLFIVELWTTSERNSFRRGGVDATAMLRGYERDHLMLLEALRDAFASEVERRRTPQNGVRSNPSVRAKKRKVQRAPNVYTGSPRELEPEMEVLTALMTYPGGPLHFHLDLHLDEIKIATGSMARKGLTLVGEIFQSLLSFAVHQGQWGLLTTFFSTNPVVVQMAVNSKEDWPLFLQCSRTALECAAMWSALLSHLEKCDPATQVTLSRGAIDTAKDDFMYNDVWRLPEQWYTAVIGLKRTGVTVIGDVTALLQMARNSNLQLLNSALSVLACHQCSG